MPKIGMKSIVRNTDKLLIRQTYVQAFSIFMRGERDERNDTSCVGRNIRHW